MARGYLNNYGILNLKKELVRLKKLHGRGQKFRNAIYMGFNIEPIHNLAPFIRKKLRTTNKDFTKWVLEL